MLDERLIVGGDSVCMSFFKLQDFPDKYKEWHDNLKKEPFPIEKEGALLLETDFSEVERVAGFIDEVFAWGGRTYGRVRHKIYKEQDEEEFINMVGEAAVPLREGNVKEAIEKIMKVKGLAMSYGSKILRMLAPQHAAVYDSVLAGWFSYSDADPTHYAEFCNDCRLISEELKKKNIKHPIRENGEWFIADVEATVFKIVKGW